MEKWAGSPLRVQKRRLNHPSVLPVFTPSHTSCTRQVDYSPIITSRPRWCRDSGLAPGTRAAGLASGLPGVSADVVGYKYPHLPGSRGVSSMNPRLHLTWVFLSLLRVLMVGGCSVIFIAGVWRRCYDNSFAERGERQTSEVLSWRHLFEKY